MVTRQARQTRSWPNVVAFLWIAPVMAWCLGAVASPAAAADASWPSPKAYPSPVRDDPGTWCDNGILRVRASKSGITWFDVYHPKDRRWYVNKNNLNLVTRVPGKGWQNSELEELVPKVEVVSKTDDLLKVRYHYAFPNGARIYTDMSLRRGEARVRFELHQDKGSAEITGVQWHITFGQAEAVRSLDFDGKRIVAAELPRPFPGGRMKMQHLKWFKRLDRLEFLFRGKETAAPDPQNPRWMSRVLGLEQHVTWGMPMRPRDRFAYEARDQPWQPRWRVPKTTPWIEGLWFVRLGAFPEGDTLTFAIDNLIPPAPDPPGR